ncbi:hypothetical protein PUNSTDRAFT_134164 [Punctularia strigosozonata HHB-11173 SS5]|uniref:uncharacterized protein n=1 Tax=Punctularia strigosozonata (strain HHB-11173) TaxID=741275 RepID=UPI0004416BC2|nr:uncharacterized protein PUNSTDRAFT_134164 [Punctularia strigosozonata HHB-11173 SS5]EIN08990.1 hypothetical protein PUNSTDRAFT_134164 [Punctularia strigosozonata HHB-11173 SS5]
MDDPITLEANVFFHQMRILLKCVERKTTEFGSYAFVDRMLGAWAMSGRVFGKNGKEGVFTFTPQHRMAIDNSFESLIPDFAALVITEGDDGIARDDLVFLWECKIDRDLKWWDVAKGNVKADDMVGESTLDYLYQVQKAAALAIEVYDRRINCRPVYAFLRVNAHFTLLRFRAIPGNTASGEAILLKEFDMEMEFVYFIKPIFEGDIEKDLRPSLAFLQALDAVTSVAAAEDGLQLPKTFFAIPPNARHTEKPKRSIHSEAKTVYEGWLERQQQSAQANLNEMVISGTTAVSSNDNYVPGDSDEDSEEDSEEDEDEDSEEDSEEDEDEDSDD